MAYNDFIVRTLRSCFDIRNGKFTNCALLFAYNGTGKTRLSYDFAHYDREEGSPKHTLYYNAYTEDIFFWDNELGHFNIDQGSSLIQGIAGYNFSDKLRQYLHVFTDIDFEFHYDEENEEIPDYVTFSKIIKNGQGEIINEVDNIKISRGEERLFVWCFFRCILDLIIGGEDAYKSIEYIYIDDPMSSLDDNNVIAFAQQLYSVIRTCKEEEKAALEASKEFRRIKFIVSSHHALFFHVMQHGLSGDEKLGRYYLNRNKQDNRLTLKYMGKDDPFYYNVAMMSEVKRAIETDNLYTYHFTIIRSVMEKIKEFFGHRALTFILEGIHYKGETYDNTAFSQEDLTDFYARVMNVLTHQGSMFTPRRMNDDNKELATALFDHLMEKFPFKLPDLNDYHSENTDNE